MGFRTRPAVNHVRSHISNVAIFPPVPGGRASVSSVDSGTVVWKRCLTSTARVGSIYYKGMQNNTVIRYHVLATSSKLVE